MEILENLSPDVLIYIQNVRKFFTTNVETREYFKIDDDEDKFFDHVIEQAQKNFEETGIPELSIEQFEEMKVKQFDMQGVFIPMGHFGLISLN